MLQSPALFSGRTDKAKRASGRPSQGLSKWKSRAQIVLPALNITATANVAKLVSRPFIVVSSFQVRFFLPTSLLNADGMAYGNACANNSNLRMNELG